MICPLPSKHYLLLSALHNLPSTLYVRSTSYSLHLTLYNLPLSLHPSTTCTLCSLCMLYNLPSKHYLLHPALYKSTLYSLHSTLNPLSFTSYSLHLTLCNLLSTQAVPALYTLFVCCTIYPLIKLYQLLSDCRV